jgi:hypothetical protein
LPPDSRTALIIVIAAAGAARELGLMTIPLPQNARQIPQEVLQLRLRRGSLQFGFELGTGVRTYVSASTPYVLALGLLLSRQDLLPTVLTGTAFGAGRALSAALTLWSRDPDRGATIAARMTWVMNITAITILGALAVLLII